MIHSCRCTAGSRKPERQFLQTCLKAEYVSTYSSFASKQSPILSSGPSVVREAQFTEAPRLDAPASEAPASDATGSEAPASDATGSEATASGATAAGAFFFSIA